MSDSRRKQRVYNVYIDNNAGEPRVFFFFLLKLDDLHHSTQEVRIWFQQRINDTSGAATHA